jgi:hypothetical protein
MPTEFSPAVVMFAEFVTITVDAAPPEAPTPPIENPPLVPVEKSPVTLKPPLPPPPPTLCARMPSELSPAVEIVAPPLVNVTAPAPLPVPPFPPRLTAPVGPELNAPATLKPPLPPPPPILCATNPGELLPMLPPAIAGVPVEIVP